jgi:transposase-like protein
MAAHRRQHSAEFKAKIVLQLLSGEKTSAERCRTHKLNTNMLNRWRKEFVEQSYHHGDYGQASDLRLPTHHRDAKAAGLSSQSQTSEPIDAGVAVDG